jgi:uncharacterized protein YecE (DUF72 family)
MISNHLNEVERRRHDATDLSAQIAQFLASGGKIVEPAPAPIKHKTTSERRQPPIFQRPALKVETSEQVARIREMAKTLSRVEICKKEGLSLGTLRGIASRYAIKFEVRHKVGTSHNRVSAELEELLVTQIKECIAKGASRQQCCDSVGISSSLLYRLIDDYEIDYPKQKNAFR